MQEWTHLFLNRWGPEGFLCGYHGEAAWTPFLAAPESAGTASYPGLSMVPLEVGSYASPQGQGLHPQWPSLEGQAHHAQAQVLSNVDREDVTLRRNILYPE